MMSDLDRARRAVQDIEQRVAEQEAALQEAGERHAAAAASWEALCLAELDGAGNAKAIAAAEAGLGDAGEQVAVRRYG